MASPAKMLSAWSHLVTRIPPPIASLTLWNVWSCPVHKGSTKIYFCEAAERSKHRFVSAVVRHVKKKKRPLVRWSLVFSVASSCVQLSETNATWWSRSAVSATFMKIIVFRYGWIFQRCSLRFMIILEAAVCGALCPSDTCFYYCVRPNYSNEDWLSRNALFQHISAANEHTVFKMS